MHCQPWHVLFVEDSKVLTSASVPMFSCDTRAKIKETPWTWTKDKVQVDVLLFCLPRAFNVNRASLSTMAQLSNNKCSYRWFQLILLCSEQAHFWYSHQTGIYTKLKTLRVSIFCQFLVSPLVFLVHTSLKSEGWWSRNCITKTCNLFRSGDGNFPQNHFLLFAFFDNNAVNAVQKIWWRNWSSLGHWTCSKQDSCICWVKKRAWSNRFGSVDWKGIVKSCSQQESSWQSLLAFLLKKWLVYDFFFGISWFKLFVSHNKVVQQMQGTRTLVKGNTAVLLSWIVCSACKGFARNHS